MTTPEELDAQIRNAEALLAMNASGSTVPRIPHAAVEIIHGLTSAITALRARVAELEAERDDARAMLAKANNEFGSETWSWPDLWRRIAQLKDLSNERWRRAEAAEAELARLGQVQVDDLAMAIAVDMEVHAAISTTTKAKAEAIAARIRAALVSPGDGVAHASDCAVHNAPAYPPGPCDCGAAPPASEGA